MSRTYIGYKTKTSEGLSPISWFFYFIKIAKRYEGMKLGIRNSRLGIGDCPTTNA